MRTLKKDLEEKLGNALTELFMRMKTGNMSQVQRMYGFVLGLRIALQALNIADSTSRYEYRNNEIIEKLLNMQFGALKLKEVRAINIEEIMRSYEYESEVLQ